MDGGRLLRTAILPMAALLAAGGAWYFAAHKSFAWSFGPKSSPPSSTTNVLPANREVAPQTNAQAPSPTLVPDSAIADIQFVPPQKIGTISFEDKSSDDETDTTYQFYRVGNFVRGPHQGAELLMASVSQFVLPCKESCNESFIVRYIEKDKIVFPLPRISDPHAGNAPDARAFAALKATLGQASDFDIPALEYPQTITAGPRAILQRREEGIGVVNPALLQVAFHDPIYGDVWMTKPGLGPQKAFFNRCEDINLSTRGTEAGCADLPPFTDNAFYFFRPDGTYLSYIYKPDFNPDDNRQTTWNDGPLPDGASFRDVTLADCSWGEIDAISVVSPAFVNPADLEAIGKVNATGDVLYGLKDKTHRLYQDFYDEYASFFPTWESRSQSDQERKPLSYSDFLKARPLFLWKDPFGRWIRFVNTRFVVPNACEPVVYLYPPQKEDIRVSLGEDVVVSNSYPVYRLGWSVSAQPEGDLTDLATGRRLPYLFWEGHSYILPSPATGFVVKSSDVSIFLEDILPRLGLNAKETGDFITAWTARLNQSPYYFISFLDRPVIDRVFPLRVDPEPDSVIRVFMDFRPLSRPISVQPPTLPAAPQRHGFTVVEWGVLVR